MSFQDDTGKFTMVSHVLAKEVGLVCAAVYGSVWRYCQMPEGICRASLNTLGADLSIDRATVLRSIDKLCKLGYLVDQTPTRRNAPHTYVLGKSVALCNTSIDTTVAVCNTDSNETVAYNNSSKESVAQNNATVAECNATVAESYLKRVLEETPLRDDSKRERESRALETQPEKLERIGVVDYLAQNQAFAIKLCEVCGNPGPEYVVNGKRRELAEATAQLLEWKATIEQLQEFRDRWKFDDDPWLSQIVGQWGRFINKRQKVSTNGHKRQPKQGPVSTPEEQDQLRRIYAATLTPADDTD